MDYETEANGSSPPPAPNGSKGKLAQAYESRNQDAIYKAVYQHAESLLRYSGRDYAEGHATHEDLAQTLAIKVMSHIAQGLFTGTGKDFVAWVNKIVWNRRLDYYKAANKRRKDFVPLLVTMEDEEGKEEIENPLIARAGERMPCAKQLPIDPTGFDPAILRVMCDDINIKRVRYANQRAMPALSAEDEKIVAAMLDEEKPNYQEIASTVGTMSAKQVENRLNTIRRRERKRREQALVTTRSAGGTGTWKDYSERLQERINLRRSYTRGRVIVIDEEEAA